jgi:hypothetical protein
MDDLDLLQEALQLPPEARAKLAGQLIGSLDASPADPRELGNAARGAKS